MLKHDEQGFLTGEGGVSRNDYAAKFMQVWANIAQGVRATVRNTDAIRADLHAMRSSLQARESGTPQRHRKTSPEEKEKRSRTPPLLALPKARGEESTASRTHAETREKTPASKPVGRKEPAEKSPFKHVVTKPAQSTKPEGAVPSSRPVLITTLSPTDTSTPLPKEVAEKVYRKEKNQANIRGENGRFVKRGERGESGIATPTMRGEDPENKSSGILSGVIGRLADAVNETVQGTEQADPAVQAMREIATPMARGWELISGGDSNKRQESWLRRIFSRLGNMGDNAKNTGKETNKKLAEIEKKPAGNGGADGGGLLAALASILPMILPLLTKIPLLGPVLALGGKLISSVAGALLGAGAGLFKKKPAGGVPAGKVPAGKVPAGGVPAGKVPAGGVPAGGVPAGKVPAGGVPAGKVPAGKVPAGGVPAGKVPAGGVPAGGAPAGGVPAGVEAGTVAKKSVGAASKLVNFGKGILRKIPLIGALLAGAGAASEIYDSETSKETRRTKDKTAGKAVGGLGGTIAGGAAGFKIGALAGSVFGPIGTAIGGVIGAMVGAFLGDQAGQIIGDKFGEWTNDLRAYGLPGKITAAWNTTVKWFTDSWDRGIAEFKAIPEKITAAWNGFVRMVADKFGIKLPTLDGGAKKPTVPTPAVPDGAKKPPAPDGGGWTKPFENAYNATKEVAADLWKKGKAQAEKLANQGVVKSIVKDTTVGKGAVAAGTVTKVAAEKTVDMAGRAYKATAETVGSVLESAMPIGYRKKALFPGIKGGDTLTIEGRYTDAEAEKIRALKTSGADTSAHPKGGMSIEIQDKVAYQAKKAGLDPVMMQKFVAMESGGNANAISPTGAIGIGQMTGRTASNLGIKDRFDVDQNIEGIMKLNLQNKAILGSKNNNFPATAENLYMMYQLGPKAALEVLRGARDGKSKSDMSKDTQGAMNKNFGANSKTAADYISVNKQALDDRYAVETKSTGGSKVASARAQQATTPTTASAPTTPATTLAATKPPTAPVVATNGLQTPVPTAAAKVPTKPAVVVFSDPPKAPPSKVATAVPDYKPPQVDGATSLVASNTNATGGMPDVSQHVSNPAIAHILTGGIGMGG